MIIRTLKDKNIDKQRGRWKERLCEEKRFIINFDTHGE